MHVVHLETGRHVYGGARQALLLARGLKGRGVTSTFVCVAGSPVAAEALRSGLEVREIAMRGDLDFLAVGRIARLLRELQPDLLHVHSRRGADWVGGRAARRAGVPAVLSRRVDRPLGRLAAALKLRPYERIVAISGAIRAQLEAAGVAPARIALIRSAVEPQLGEPQWTRERLLRELALAPHAQLVGCIAQLIPRKGHATLLEAWAAVAVACPEARLVLLGQGKLEAELRRSSRAAGLQGSVVFAGFRPELKDFLGHLDLIVHPAREEGLGLALLEAQAAGVPVVAFRAGGVPEIVADGRTGYLVRTGDAPALAIALTELLQNETRRRALGAAAWEWAAREFRVADMVDAHLTLYGQVRETRRR